MDTSILQSLDEESRMIIAKSQDTNSALLRLAELSIQFYDRCLKEREKMNRQESIRAEIKANEFSMAFFTLLHAGEISLN